MAVGAWGHVREVPRPLRAAWLDLGPRKLASVSILLVKGERVGVLILLGCWARQRIMCTSVRGAREAARGHLRQEAPEEGGGDPGPPSSLPAPHTGLLSSFLLFHLTVRVGGDAEKHPLSLQSVRGFSAGPRL